ncbi:MAG: hypothetical protein WEC34_13170, partial [Acidimicrobiia bacterium]
MRLSTVPMTVRDASRVLGVVAAAVLVSAMATTASAAGTGAGDAGKRLDDMQVLGTHNSYHLRPAREITP